MSLTLPESGFARQSRHLDDAARLLPGGAIGGYALNEAVRFVATEGRGPRLQDEAGRHYVDYVMGAGALILGHSHPDVTAAIVEQAMRGTHFFASLSVPAIELAALATSMIPCAERLAFTTSGSEATYYALRMARAFTGREKILKFEGSYHGNHDYSLVATTPPRASNYPAGRADSGGVPGGVADTVLVAPYNDADAVRAIMRQHGSEIAAIIVEPIQRVIAPAPGFLEALRAAADRAGAVLIFDEVVTGFRLAMGGAQDYFGVRPDLAAYGKIIGGGLGTGAVAGRADIIDCASPARKGQPGFAYVNGTLHGNPLASAAGLATLRALQQPGFHAALNSNTAQLREELSACLRRHGLPARIVGIASMWQVLFCEREPRNYIDVLDADMKRTRAFDEALIRAGIYVLPGVRRLVSGVHGPAEFEETIAAFDAVCAQFS
jgi:glutamate-1-semialdehyde 2,1-aminomutase